MISLLHWNGTTMIFGKSCIVWRLQTNGFSLGNYSKFILLSDNLNICLWLSICQIEKINEINNFWLTIISDSVKWKLHSEIVNTFDLHCTHSCEFYSRSKLIEKSKCTPFWVCPCDKSQLIEVRILGLLILIFSFIFNFKPFYYQTVHFIFHLHHFVYI